MREDDYDGQMIFGDLVDLKLPDICLTGEEKPRKNLTQETYPDRGSNPGPQRDRRACYRLAHSGGLFSLNIYHNSYRRLASKRHRWIRFALARSSDLCNTEDAVWLD